MNILKDLEGSERQPLTALYYKATHHVVKAVLY